MDLQQTNSENIVRKGGIAHNEQYPLFDTMFSTFLNICIFNYGYFCLDALRIICCKLDVCGKGLNNKSLMITGYG